MAQWYRAPSFVLYHKIFNQKIKNEIQVECQVIFIFSAFSPQEYSENLVFLKYPNVYRLVLWLASLPTVTTGDL